MGGEPCHIAGVVVAELTRVHRLIFGHCATSNHLTPVSFSVAVGIRRYPDCGRQMGYPVVGGHARLPTKCVPLLSALLSTQINRRAQWRFELRRSKPTDLQSDLLGVCTDKLRWLRSEQAGQPAGSVGWRKRPLAVLRTICGRSVPTRRGGRSPVHQAMTSADCDQDRHASLGQGTSRQGSRGDEAEERVGAQRLQRNDDRLSRSPRRSHSPDRQGNGRGDTAFTGPAEAFTTGTTTINRPIDGPIALLGQRDPEQTEHRQVNRVPPAGRRAVA